MTSPLRLSIAVDRGGSFTDCIGVDLNNQQNRHVIKLLSVDPNNYKDAPLEGIRRLLEKFTGDSIPQNVPLDTDLIESIRMGTTVATNALLERKGERCALIITKGFKDSIIIGDQTRPDIFNLNIEKSQMLYESVVEIDERITLEDFTEDSESLKTNPNIEPSNLITGLSGETIRILQKPNPLEITFQLQKLFDTGIKSISIALVHSYIYPQHEEIIAKIAQKIGFEHISLSSKLSPMIKFIPRASSSITDSYLTPEIKKYLQGFLSGLKEPINSRIEFMKSDGGLINYEKFSGINSILSGPAGGVVGCAKTSFSGIPTINYDAGGTSTDVSRYSGSFDHVFETSLDGVIIQAPQLDIKTIAAGGGSKLFWKNKLFKVGPESAGSHPGPACYRKNGPLTVTDANLTLGRLLPEFFPKILGPNQDLSLDVETTYDKFQELTNIINKDNNSNLSVEDVALGFVKVANETMARPIRQITESKGFKLSNHRLISFGGSGGQHAVEIAKILTIDTVLIHKYSSILSAYGILLADVVEESQEPCSLVLKDGNQSTIVEKFDSLIDKNNSKLLDYGFKKDEIVTEKFLNLRFNGMESSIMIKASSFSEFRSEFLSTHKREFGFNFDDKDILIDDIRIRSIGSNSINENYSIDDELASLTIKDITSDKVKFTKPVYFEQGKLTASVYRIEDLTPGTKIPGPAIIADDYQTNVIPPGSYAISLKNHLFVKIESLEQSSSSSSSEETTVAEQELKVDPITLSIFSHKFMDIAEQMGNQLRNTSVSTNVKERLDFSCALFNAQGDLVANAPYIPVHLGSMSTCIKKQIEIWDGKLQPGDVLVTNHPENGGTHLPDITVITPAFHNGEIIFYVASRCHHADIGGSKKGSMPPNSKELWEEGTIIKSELLVHNGIFNEERMIELFLHEPAKYPNCSGSRKIQDNLSDLKSQVSSNQKGIQLIEKLIDENSSKLTMFYMSAIQENAAYSVRTKLLELRAKFQSNVFENEDFMDDGSKIKLKITINEKGDSIFDFTGTSPQVYGNLNAPESITYSAVIYCLRCLVADDIPLNQGCLDPVELIIPKGSLLSPLKGAAVVAGNVMTSQRITDVVLKAFKISADSQGDCNNLTFGYGGHNEKGEYIQGFGYYETICGGHGAGFVNGKGWNGTSGVHTNMTNTRMTDVEVFEKRYPVLLKDFSIREGSGGSGKFKGGNGISRDIEFRKPLEVSILSERRVNQPNGLLGGGKAERGVNLWVKENGQIINIGGKNTIDVSIGDRIVIKTPGGGGFGTVEEEE
ncbi:hypothetical protein WICMUC_000069 [Wickerhamomyces mucosus]|uniref:5-oxoprolinase n=1 Tax=Wickerhamomyces mucosus TaxID=1378264 RepID=A0A9P8TJA4_9ASCO|nr:hypothetical protein WICMUC_000069 [Wickerhamomyces mucosus]